MGMEEELMVGAREKNIKKADIEEEKEWLELEKNAEVRHEFYYGKLIPMAGEAKKANRISKTLVKLMDDHLLEHGYEAFYLRACWGFGFRGKNRQFFDETRRKNGSIAIPK